MKLAIKQAHKSFEKDLFPVGAILVVDDQAVLEASKDNSHSYHTDHAEIMLLRDFFKGKKIKRGQHNIELFTTLEPCLMCIGTILHLPINRLVYSATDPYGGGVISYPKTFYHQGT